MARICRLVGLCEAFIGFCCDVMVCVSVLLFTWVTRIVSGDTEFCLSIEFQLGVLVLDDTGGDNRPSSESSDSS
jgi:hypothetical protein